jgi:AcrR family transcriptional regulator
MNSKSPSERRYARTRDAILDAARTLIVEKGVEQLSMRTLADAVDYSPSALYNYFDGKQAILEALRKEGWALMATMEQQLPQDLSPAELLLENGLNYLRFAERYPAHYQLIMDPTDDVPDSLEAFIIRPNFKELLDYVEILVASNEITLPMGYDVLHMAFLIWFLVHGISMVRAGLLRNCGVDFDALSEQVLRGLLNTFTNQ